jgi:hypothetical protein
MATNRKADKIEHRKKQKDLKNAAKVHLKKVEAEAEKNRKVKETVDALDGKPAMLERARVKAALLVAIAKQSHG